MFKQARMCGFTLVELLVVMSIIAVLMCLLVPTITKAVEVVKKDRTLSEFKELGISIQSFRNDWGDIPPSKPRVPPDTSQAKTDGSSGDMPTGAANLAYYLLGPGGGGWGTAGGGTMPFAGAGTPTRAYGPYYQVESDCLGYEKKTDGTTVLSGFLDAFKGGYWDMGSSRFVPRGRILYFKANLTGIPPTTSFDVNDNVADQNGQTNYVDQTKFVEAVAYIGIQVVLGDSTTWRWPRQDYLLISPGPDGHYGYTKKDSNGNIVPALINDAGVIVPLDDISN